MTGASSQASPARPRRSFIRLQVFPVEHQGETHACTGFGLALVVEHLRLAQDQAESVSPFMLYSMARRYDEFAGSARNDDEATMREVLRFIQRHP